MLEEDKMAEKKQRLIEFDILKGLLIVSVVIGHAVNPSRWFDVFWFHMPAFFMLSGYMSKNWSINKESILHRIVRLWLPYISYCIVLLPFIPDCNCILQMIKFVIGGGNSTTCLTYPFWYVNSLLVALISYSLLKHYLPVRWLVCVLSILWTFIHIIHVPDYLPVYLPLGIDMAFGAICYIAMGDFLKKENNSKYIFIFCLVPVLISVCNGFGFVDYRLNMMSMKYEHIILDLLVPFSFTLAFYMISRTIKLFNTMAILFSSLGKASMTIMFLHVAVLYCCRQLNFVGPVGILLAIIIPWSIHFALNKYKYTGIVFLGNYKEIRDR